MESAEQVVEFKAKVNVELKAEINAKEDLTDREYVIAQFQTFYDLYAIFKDRLINEFKKRLQEVGWSPTKIIQLEMEGVNRSNWSKNSFLDEEVRRNTKDKPERTNYMRR